MRIERGGKWIQEVLKDSELEKPGTSLEVHMKWMRELEIVRHSSLDDLLDNRAIHQPMERVHLVFILSNSHDPLTISRFITFVEPILLYEYAEKEFVCGLKSVVSSIQTLS